MTLKPTLCKLHTFYGNLESNFIENINFVRYLGIWYCKISNIFFSQRPEKKRENPKEFLQDEWAYFDIWNFSWILRKHSFIYLLKRNCFKREKNISKKNFFGQKNTNYLDIFVLHFSVMGSHYVSLLLPKLINYWLNLC